MADVVVVGAGIVGASVAAHCARLGAAVTLVDKALPGAGATGASFAWIGASDRVPGPGGPLHAAALREWRRLAGEVADVRIRWTGSLSWGGPLPADLEPGRHLVPADEIAALEPNLRRPPDRALRIPGDGVLDPLATTDALVATASGHGARVLTGTAVTGLHVERGRVTGVSTTAGVEPADTVVLAAGADAPVLCAPLGVALPVRPSPALLVRLTGPPDLVRTLVATPEVEVRSGGDGELLATLSYTGEATSSQLRRSAERARGLVAGMFRGAEDVRVRTVHVGMRPMPVAENPLIGSLPDVPGAYVAVVHPGVTLAPVVGRLVAEEVVRGDQAPELRGCRPR